MLHPYLFLEKISKEGTGIKSRKGVTEGSSSFFCSRAVLPSCLMLFPNWVGHSGKERHQSAKFGRKATLPRPRTHRGVFMSY